MIHILCRRTKNNPVLVRETSVGKTAIAEGLAQPIASGEVMQMREKSISLAALSRLDGAGSPGAV